MSDNKDFNIDALVAWAESDAPAKSGVVVAAGEQAAHEGRALLRMAGRPTVGSNHARGEGSSPRRQVRLPRDVNNALDAYVRQEHTSASDVIRLALDEYLRNHHAEPRRA